jgi:hypothetical protein
MSYNNDHILTRRDRIVDECSGFENRRLALERDRGFESPSLRHEVIIHYYTKSSHGDLKKYLFKKNKKIA